MRLGFRAIAAGLLVAALRAPAGVAPHRVSALPTDLAGTWEIAPGDPAGGIESVRRMRFSAVRVPGSWQSAGIPGHGFAWYRLLFEIDPSLWPVPVALTCEQMRDSDEVYLDGVLVGRTGRFPPDYEKGTLMGRVYPLPADMTSGPGTHELLVRVYNAGPREGGITGSVAVASVHDAFVARARRELPRLLLAAAIGSLGLFSLFVFLRDRSQTGFLTFFVFTVGFAIYVATWTSAWTESRVSLDLVFRVNLALALALFALFLVFFLRFFERPFGKLHRVLIVLQSGLALVCMLWPRVDDLYYVLPVGYLAILVGSADVFRTLLRDSRRGVPYARPFFAGCVLAFCCVVFDMGQDFGILGDPVGSLRLAGPGFFVFSLVVLSLAADRIARLRTAASTDPLTGLANRSVLHERLLLELARARRGKHPMAAAVLDLDHFKRFNDRFGHLVGDKLLVAAAGALREAVRDTDLVARYGGEEFVLILPEAGRSEVLVVLERVRLSVAALRVPGADEGTTASIGVAVYDPVTSPPSFSSNAFLRLADGALYQAKEQGRNRIVAAEGLPARGFSSGVFSEEIARPLHRIGE